MRQIADKRSSGLSCSFDKKLQMLPLHFLCLKNTPPFSIAEPLYFQKNPKIVFSRHPVLTGGDEDGIKRRRGRTTVHAVEKDSQQFEVDPDKAKQALKQLDLQLESLSKKQVSTPKIKGTPLALSVYWFRAIGNHLHLVYFDSYFIFFIIDY